MNQNQHGVETILIMVEWKKIREDFNKLRDRFLKLKIKKI